MQIKVTAEQQLNINAGIFAIEANWVIVDDANGVHPFKSRAAARNAKISGKLIKASELVLEVEAPAPVFIFTEVPKMTPEEIAKFENEHPAEAAAIKAAAKAKIEITRTSTVERPCKQVWHIADAMAAEVNGFKNLRRKDVLAKCVASGIAFYTARTQYQLWLTIQNGGTI